MSNYVTTTNEWGQLDPRDALTDIDEKTGAIIRAAIPSDHDLSMQAVRALQLGTKGVEFVTLRKTRRHILINDISYVREKTYAKVSIDGEYVWGLRHGDEKHTAFVSDIVRNRCLAAARDMGERVANLTHVRRQQWMKHGEPLTVRAHRLVYAIHEFGVEPPKRRVFSSMQTDETLIYFASYFTIAPAGEDEYESERFDV